ncbi:flagellar FlbD family protein [Arthrobacter sp. STN4]|uniref:flagellar FlbD family protein n=1 Tax=Arthrobacter sp. STN4 TaxID=2923276 RepID=UPI002119F468|nr:flagellar FlbD family protein [Arthrobacter sp. STN4]MCQ9162509.1 flagellar FlbD family protein [Arthrobacter sp. STN4]
MIVVTRLDGCHFAVNPDLVERIFEAPDTTLVMADGARFIVTESMEEVIEKIVRFRAHVISTAYNDPGDEDSPAGGRTSSRLSVIHPAGPAGGTTTGRQ